MPVEAVSCTHDQLETISAAIQAVGGSVADELQVKLAALQTEGRELAANLAILRETLQNAAVGALNPAQAASGESSPAQHQPDKPLPGLAHLRYPETARKARQQVGRTDYGAPT